MGKLTALKKLLGIAEDNEGKIAENVGKRSDKVSDEQVEDTIEKASEKVNDK